MLLAAWHVCILVIIRVWLRGEWASIFVCMPAFVFSADNGEEKRRWNTGYKWLSAIISIAAWRSLSLSLCLTRSSSAAAACTIACFNLEIICARSERTLQRERQCLTISGQHTLVESEREEAVPSQHNQLRNNRKIMWKQMAICVVH